jgi:superfamily II DNA or RNA helicase
MTAALILHPFQNEAVDRIERDLEAHCKVLLVAPTGAGKTVIASEIIKRAVDDTRPSCSSLIAARSFNRPATSSPPTA